MLNVKKKYSKKCIHAHKYDFIFYQFLDGESILKKVEIFTRENNWRFNLKFDYYFSFNKVHLLLLSCIVYQIEYTCIVSQQAGPPPLPDTAKWRSSLTFLLNDLLYTVYLVFKNNICCVSMS